MDNPFVELGIDPIEGSEIMMTAGIKADDLRDINNVAKLRDIMQYFSGKSDKDYMIQKLLLGKNVPNTIDHLWGYCSLRGKYDDINKKAEELKEQLFFYER